MSTNPSNNVTNIGHVYDVIVILTSLLQRQCSTFLNISEQYLSYKYLEEKSDEDSTKILTNFHIATALSIHLEIYLIEVR